MEKVKKYFPELSEDKIEQFSSFLALFRSWNEKINLISRADMENLEERHLLHSLSIAKFVDFRPGTSIMDIGTGGGFPGLPLATLYPECNFFLVDSIGKKIMVVNDMIEKLNLQNVSAQQIRAEQVKKRFDFITSRAVAQTGKLLDWSKNNFNKKQKNTVQNGWLLLKGGDLDEELRQIHRKHKLIPLSNYFEEDFFTSKFLVYLPAGGDMERKKN